MSKVARAQIFDRVNQEALSDLGEALHNFVKQQRSWSNELIQLRDAQFAIVVGANTELEAFRKAADQPLSFHALKVNRISWLRQAGKTEERLGEVLAQLQEFFTDPEVVGIQGELKQLQESRTKTSAIMNTPRATENEDRADYQKYSNQLIGFIRRNGKPIEEKSEQMASVQQALGDFIDAAESPDTKLVELTRKYRRLVDLIDSYGKEVGPKTLKIKVTVEKLYASYRSSEMSLQRADVMARRTRRDIDHRKILEHLIDEQEEKYIELVEGTRAHLAQIDNYLKRLAIALENDFKVQFYDPAFAGVRVASREWHVNLGQVERTTILTNNRQFAKVAPQATMEFDLPKRAPMIVEGMNGARALVQEYGTLLQDPTFLSLSGMMSGAPVSAATGGAGTPVPGLPNQGLRTASVRSVLPGQSTDTSEQLMSQTGGPDRKFGTALEGLIPDPAIYKFETGTGFEIRPVIQPDGHSVIYDFDYMYTTNVREPVRPDEKHLGRVKRHFIHTQVQTSSFELREISRYQVALKVSRTSRGVPLLEDIPGAGVLFRPLPSDESSLQQNIILGQSTVYPTLFDLMGLRWSKYVVDLDHLNLRDLEHVTRGREQAIRDFTFDDASKRVDEFLDIKNKHDEHLRPDLYHQQRQASPYHPGGHHYVPRPAMEDPGNRGFTIPDRRPEEYREPAYDTLRRNPIDPEWQQLPGSGGQPEPLDSPIMPPNVPPGPQGLLTRPRAQQSRSSPAAKGVGQSQKMESSAVTIQTATIQTATFQVRPQIPKVIDDKASSLNATLPVAESVPSNKPKKKTWVGAFKAPFAK